MTKPSAHQVWRQLIALGHNLDYEHGDLTVDEEKIEKLVLFLMHNNNDSIPKWCIAALRSRNAWTREAAARVLAEYKLKPTKRGKAMRRRMSAALVKAAELEYFDEVRLYLVRAIGWSKDLTLWRVHLRYAKDESARIRDMVATSIPKLVPTPVPDEAVKTLIELMNDPVPMVRDWATFSLSDMKVDTPEVREAFLRNVKQWRLDAEYETGIAGEAAIGLANRHDPRVLPFIEEMLDDINVYTVPVEAAHVYGDPMFLPQLWRLYLERWPPESPMPVALQFAIETLNSKTHRGED